MRRLTFLFGCLIANVRALPFSSLHLITACITFYGDVHNIAKKTVAFNTSTCLYDKSEIEPAVNKIIALAATEPRVALVASGAHFPDVEEPYARAIRAGVAVFFIEFGIDFAKWGLAPNDMLSVVFFPDNGMGARDTGREFCRMRSEQTEQRVALFYGLNHELDVRCDAVVEEFRKECPHVNLKVVRTLRTPDWGFESAKEMIKPVFLAEPTLTGVITAADILGMGVIAAADELLPPADAERLVVTGFDHADFVIPFLRNKRILATVDQLSNKISSTGMWHTIPNFLKVVQEQSINSTAAVKEYFGLKDHLVYVPTLHIASDGEGQTSAKLAKTMASSVRATPLSGGGPSIVSVAIKELQVQEYLVELGAFQANFWMELSWYDKRLRWDVLQYNGTLSWDSSELWTPKLVLLNRQSVDELIIQGRAVIHPDGQIILRTKFQGHFRCPLSVAPFPFTLFTCSVDIGTDLSRDTLQFEMGSLEIDSGPTDYYPLENLGATQVHGKTDSAHFTFRAVHKTSFVLTGYVLGAWLLNVISFTQLYLPSDDDRTGFAMATILAAMVLQMEAKASKHVTWLDLYLLLSLLFQVTAFMTSISARRTAKLLSLDDEEAQAAEVRRSASGTISYKAKSGHRQAAFKALAVIFGLQDPTTHRADRWCRRLLTPFFLLLCLLMCFGPMGVSNHPEHGVNCPLFWLSLVCLIPFLLGAVILIVHAWSVKIN